MARSFVPGALSAWVLYNKSIPLAPLELTVEVPERVGARGEVVEPLDEEPARKALRRLYARGVEALTISLFNAYANSVHERRLARDRAGRGARRVGPVFRLDRGAAAGSESSQSARQRPGLPVVCGRPRTRIAGPAEDPAVPEAIIEAANPYMPCAVIHLSPRLPGLSRSSEDSGKPINPPFSHKFD